MGAESIGVFQILSAGNSGHPAIVGPAACTTPVREKSQGMRHKANITHLWGQSPMMYLNALPGTVPNDVFNCVLRADTRSSERRINDALYIHDVAQAILINIGRAGGCAKRLIHFPLHIRHINHSVLIDIARGRY